LPKLSHEALVQLVRAAPDMIVGLLQRELGLELPAQAHPRITAAELVDLNLAEYRADVVITLGPADMPSEVFVLEAQNEVDARKLWTWPLYVAGLRARFACPVTLVIVALDRRVAAWCAEPINLGRGRGSIAPLVLGPAQIPVIVDVDEACRNPELAVLSVRPTVASRGPSTSRWPRSRPCTASTATVSSTILTSSSPCSARSPAPPWSSS
jgi:hypothetical protein